VERGEWRKTPDSRGEASKRIRLRILRGGIFRTDVPLNAIYWPIERRADGEEDPVVKSQCIFSPSIFKFKKFQKTICIQAVGASRYVQKFET
jgi:hypothetical protein